MQIMKRACPFVDDSAALSGDDSGDETVLVSHLVCACSPPRLTSCQSENSDDRNFIDDRPLTYTYNPLTDGPAMVSSDDEDDSSDDEGQRLSPPSPVPDQDQEPERERRASEFEQPPPPSSGDRPPSASESIFLTTPPPQLIPAPPVVGVPVRVADVPNPQRALPLHRAAPPERPPSAPLGPGDRARAFVFTVHHYDDAAVAAVRRLIETADYGVFGREIAPETGTPHLQGYLRFKGSSSANKRTFAQLRAVLAENGFPEHLVFWCQAAKASAAVNAEYCKKDGDYEEFGEVPVQGKRTDIDKFKDAVEAGMYDRRDLLYHYPRIVEQMPRFTSEAIRRNKPPPALRPIVWKPWQQEAIEICRAAPDDRKIHFFVDIPGNAGKSTLCRELTKMFEDCQMMSSGKHVDLAYMLDEYTRTLVVDVPRCSLITNEFYQFLEQCKNGAVQCTKYQSYMKMYDWSIRVLVFTNEIPDQTALTSDRYDIRLV